MLSSLVRMVILTLGVGVSALAEVGKSDIWIDVRTESEFAGGHVPGAHNVEFQLIANRIRAITADKDAPIRLYCKSGRRSGVAKQTLIKLGYRNVHNEGGVTAAVKKHAAANEL